MFMISSLNLSAKHRFNTFYEAFRRIKVLIVLEGNRAFIDGSFDVQHFDGLMPLNVCVLAFVSPSNVAGLCIRAALPSALSSTTFNFKRQANHTCNSPLLYKLLLP